MIIQTFSNLYDEGYLDKEAYSLISPFFSGSNVAFRRKIFDQVGLYDPNCRTGEDQDICFRIAKSGWDLYFQPKALVGHKCRANVRQFFKQWYRYGFHHPYLFKKHGAKSLTLYRKTKQMKKGILYDRILHLKEFPLNTVIFISSFLIMNAFLFLTILALLFGFKIPSAILGAITLTIAVYYFGPDVEVKDWWRTAGFIFLRYLANLALLIGGLLGGVKWKMLFINGTLDYKTRDSIK